VTILTRDLTKILRQRVGEISVVDVKRKPKKSPIFVLFLAWNIRQGRVIISRTLPHPPILPISAPFVRSAL